MANRSFAKITDILSGVLKNSLSEEQTTTVLSSWRELKGDVSKVLSQTGKKKEVDPAKPKRWKSEYLFFCQEKRPGVVKANPALPPDEVISQLAAMWKTLNDAQRKKYRELSQKDKARYQAEMEKYVPSEGFEPEVKKQRTGPKRPLSAYLYFCQDRRPGVKAASPKEVSVELGRLWKALSDEEKAPFNARHEADKARYEAEKAAAPSVPAAKPAKAAASKAGKTAAPKAESKAAPKAAPKAESKAAPKAASKAAPKAESKAAPKAESKAASKAAPKAESKAASKASKAATNTPGFALFSNEQVQELEAEHPEWNEKQVNTEIAKRWGGLSADDRQAYELEAETQDDAVVTD